MKPIILNIPHSSTLIPDKTGFIIDDAEIKKEILKLTDWYTDDLFSAEDIHILKADFSRIFCDVERFADDSREIMSKSGMGMLYERADDGRLMRTVSTELRKKIKLAFYDNYHQKFNMIVKEILDEKDKCLIIDCHSFPDSPFKRDLNQERPRPDFCIGTDRFHTREELVEKIEEFIKSSGYTVKIDNPYSGTIVPSKYYQKNNNVQSVMIEVNRKLYMDEITGEKTQGYERTKKFTQSLIELLL